jgi:hypothetical protein
MNMQESSMSQPSHTAVHPQSIGAVLQSGLKLFGATFAGSVLYGTVFAIVQLLPSIYRAIWAPRVFGLRATAPGVWVVYIICVLMTLVLFAAVQLRQAAVASGGRPAGAMGEALRQLLRLTLLTIAAGIVLISLGEFLIPATQSQSHVVKIAALILGIATIYWAVAVAFAWSVVVVLKQRPFDAVVRSVRLVRSSWWGSFLMLFLALIVLLICLAVGAAPAYLWPFAVAGELLGMTAIAVLISIAVNAVGLSLLSALVIASLADLRTRAPS